jgi:hypothetical protein
MWSSEAPTLLRPSAEVCKDPIDEAYDAWKEADAAAQALQRDVSRAWARYDSGSGEPPARQQLLELASRRHAAAEKLAHAIELLHHAGHIQPAGSSRPTRRARADARGQQAAA